MQELEGINEARQKHGSAGGWLWRREPSEHAYADGPPSTPLAGPPPPRTPATEPSTGDEVGALKDKVHKLRWLLKMANEEIQKVKADKASFLS